MMALYWARRSQAQLSQSQSQLWSSTGPSKEGFTYKLSHIPYFGPPGFVKANVYSSLLSLIFVSRMIQEHVEREHREEQDIELQIAPYIYFEIKKWP